MERVCETNTRYLLPVAWNAENIPKEIKKLTFTQVVGGSEEDIHIKLSSIIGQFKKYLETLYFHFYLVLKR